MTRDKIKALALECGFSLKEQPDGSMDPNPYVYDFSNRAASAKQEPTEVTMREVTHV